MMYRIEFSQDNSLWLNIQVSMMECIGQTIAYIGSTSGGILQMDLL